MVFTIEGKVFDIEDHYVPLTHVPIGRGAYGIVAAAKDKNTGARVGIKRIGNAYDDLVDAKRILREIRLIRHLQHENISSIKDVHCPGPMENNEDIYIMTELMDTDLHKVLYSSQPLIDDHIQFFVYQILRGLKYIHSAHVLHRDLKPGNLLVNANCDLKICDFGLARLEVENPVAMTSYVVTRWYRAPELLYMKEYTSAIDIWSVGCILAELLGRKPFFQGRDFRHQLNVIFEKIGRPNKEALKIIPNQKVRDYILNLGISEKAPPLATWFPNANPKAIDLMEKMLKFNPAERITAEQALSHPYLSEYHDPSDEPTADSTFEFEFEDTTLTKDQIRKYVYNEMYAIHPEKKPTGWSMSK